MPGTSPTMLKFPPIVLQGSSTDGIAFALSLYWVSFALPSPQIASVPMNHSWGRGEGITPPECVLVCGVYPKELKVSL